ncbi:MAG: hypothetical protein AAF578_08615 [Pseudomonadota bacterium]
MKYIRVLILLPFLLLTGCVLAVGDGDSDNENDERYAAPDEIIIEREISIGATWCCASCTDPDDGVACNSCRRDAPESCRSVEVALVCDGSYTETSPGTQASIVTCLE